ncbi:hypothetical protein HD554DRAFT_2266792 [Boletus coccyginus]|nr:hypothetical protein HD554DRAFT_2266792 [Boletus coccyginus]
MKAIPNHAFLKAIDEYKHTEGATDQHNNMKSEDTDDMFVITIANIFNNVESNNYNVSTTLLYKVIVEHSFGSSEAYHRLWVLNVDFELFPDAGSSTFLLSGSVTVQQPIWQLTGHFQYSFIHSADLVMILRVYAMWNQSKWILWILLFIYMPQVIVSLVVLGIYANPNTYLSDQSGFKMSNTWKLFLVMLSRLAICPIMPQFIINVRELYDRDLRARWQGIYTGFGVLSQPIASQNVVVSAISFVDVGTGQGQGQGGDVEAIQLEELGDGGHQVVEDGHADNADVI